MARSFPKPSIARQLVASAAIGMLLILIFVLGKGRSLSSKGDELKHAASGDERHLSSSTADEEETDVRFKSSRPRVHTEPTLLERRLRAMIIPRIAFEDTTAEEAVDFLRLRTSEMIGGMAENAEEEMAGLSSDKTPSPLEGLDKQLRMQRITLERTDISAWDAISLVAREIGVKAEIVDGRVVFIK